VLLVTQRGSVSQQAGYYSSTELCNRFLQWNLASPYSMQVVIHSMCKLGQENYELWRSRFDDLRFEVVRAVVIAEGCGFYAYMLEFYILYFSIKYKNY